MRSGYGFSDVRLEIFLPESGRPRLSRERSTIFFKNTGIGTGRWRASRPHIRYSSESIQ